MTDQVKESTGGGSHMSAADRRTLNAIFHHPVPHNLSWMDTLHLLTLPFHHRCKKCEVGDS